LLTPVGYGDKASAGGTEPSLRFPVCRGGHPLPTVESVAGARRAVELVRALADHERLLLLLSGGGSALLSMPAEGLDLSHVRDTTRQLLRAGASIGELNTVRRHLERLKGGGLALEAGGRPVLTLALSDVVGNPPEDIASGPVSPDPTTYADALSVLNRYGLAGLRDGAVAEHLRRGLDGRAAESPFPGDPRLANVEYRVVADVGTAMAGSAREALRLGYRVHELTRNLTGEARVQGRRFGVLARSLEPFRDAQTTGVCLLTGGETTVEVVGTGRGGPNQELVLAAAPELDGIDGVLVGSMGTDGIDGSTDAAGALATGSTVTRARAVGVRPQAALANNDSHDFFRRLGDLLVTGATGTNVMDVGMILAEALVGSSPS
ncbi:MAG: glycerate kinase type-2 family protein, partial [bacterium]